MKDHSYLWCTEPNIFLSVSHMLSRTYNILSYVAFTAFCGHDIFADWQVTTAVFIALSDLPVKKND